MKRVLPILLAVVLILSSTGQIQSASTPPPPVEYFSHTLVAYDQGKYIVSVQMQATTDDTFWVGQISATPDNGSKNVLLNIDTPQVLPVNVWGEIKVAVSDVYTTTFNGKVAGWMQLQDQNGKMLARTELADTVLSYGPGQLPANPVESESHLVAACKVEPNQVEGRMHNLNTEDVFIDGQVKATPTGGQEKIIGSVPEQYRLVSSGNWGGAEARVLEAFPNGFDGTVSDWAEMRFSSNNALITRSELGETPVSCLPDPSTYKIYAPMMMGRLADDPQPVCSDLEMVVTPPGLPAVNKAFGDLPGPVYAFGNTFALGQTVGFATADGLPVDVSYLGWFNSYTHSTGIGPSWSLRATGFTGTPPFLGVLYTWQVQRTLPGGKVCTIAFLIHWDP